MRDTTSDPFQWICIDETLISLPSKKKKENNDMLVYKQGETGICSEHRSYLAACLFFRSLHVWSGEVLRE